MKRLFHALTAVGMLAHHVFELAAGVGLVFQPQVHFLIWPWEVRRGLPVLTEAEGFRKEQLPAYNAVLYAWAVAGLLAILIETPRGAKKWAAAGFLATLPARASARHHFVWLREQARSNPAWWNRAIAEKVREDGT